MAQCLSKTNGATLLGWNGTVTLDRHGSWYLSQMAQGLSKTNGRASEGLKTRNLVFSPSLTGVSYLA